MSVGVVPSIAKRVTVTRTLDARLLLGSRISQTAPSQRGIDLLQPLV